MNSVLSSSRRPSRAVVTLLTLVLVGSSFSTGWFLGKQQGIRSVVPEGEGRVTNQDLPPASASEDVDFGQFWDVWNLVKENYYRQPVSDKDLFYGALAGMVEDIPPQRETPHQSRQQRGDDRGPAQQTGKD